MIRNNDPKWIDIDCETEDGFKYQGRFKVKPYLSVSERGDVERSVSRATVGIPVVYDNGRPVDVYSEIRALSVIKAHLLEADADWWVNDGMDLIDNDPIRELVEAIYALKAPKKETEVKGEDK